LFDDTLHNPKNDKICLNLHDFINFKNFYVFIIRKIWKNRVWVLKKAWQLANFKTIPFWQLQTDWIIILGLAIETKVRTKFVFPDHRFLSDSPHYQTSSDFFNGDHLHVGDGVSGQLEMDADVLGGVGVRHVIFMLNIPEV